MREAAVKSSIAAARALLLCLSGAGLETSGGRATVQRPASVRRALIPAMNSSFESAPSAWGIGQSAQLACKHRRCVRSSCPPVRGGWRRAPDPGASICSTPRRHFIGRRGGPVRGAPAVDALRWIRFDPPALGGRLGVLAAERDHVPAGRAHVIFPSPRQPAQARPSARDPRVAPRTAHICFGVVHHGKLAAD